MWWKNYMVKCFYLGTDYAYSYVSWLVLLFECKHQCQIIHLGQGPSLCRPDCLCCNGFLLDLSSENGDSRSLQRIYTYADLHDIISQNIVINLHRRDVPYISLLVGVSDCVTNGCRSYQWPHTLFPWLRQS